MLRWWGGPPLTLLLLASTNLSLAQYANEYQLGSGDRVRVIVFGHEDLSGEFEVDGTGRLSLPLIREILARGRTLAELEADITDSLKPDYLINPRVNVEILNYRPFYIVGEVDQPGSYPYVTGMTVLTAVAVAGGYTYRARKNKLEIRRSSEDEQTIVSAGPDTMVLPGDIIEIAERMF